jgi:VanZ family protein
VKRTLARWLPAIAWAALIFYLSSRRTLPEPPGPLGWDKLQHVLGYGAGGFLLARAAGVRGRGLVAAIALGLLYGASDEVHQAFVPGRNSDVQDWLADALGVAAGAFIQRFITLRRGRGAGGAAHPRAEASAT